MRDMKSQEMEVLKRQLDTVESDLKQAERRIRDHSDPAIVPDNSISNDIPALSMLFYIPTLVWPLKKH